MSTSKKLLTILVCFALLLQLGACGKEAPKEGANEEADAVIIGQPQASTETEPGYVTTELPMPEGYSDFSGLQSVGDSLYLHAETQDGGFSVLRYDTLNGEWQSWLLNTGDAKNPKIDAFSAVEGAAWIRC